MYMPKVTPSSFGFTELKIGEAKLEGVKGVKRSYRPPRRA